MPSISRFIDETGIVPFLKVSSAYLKWHWKHRTQPIEIAIQTVDGVYDMDCITFAVAVNDDVETVTVRTKDPDQTAQNVALMEAAFNPGSKKNVWGVARLEQLHREQRGSMTEYASFLANAAVEREAAKHAKVDYPVPEGVCDCKQEYRAIGHKLCLNCMKLLRPRDAIKKD